MFALKCRKIRETDDQPEIQIIDNKYQEKKHNAILVYSLESSALEDT